MKNIKFISSVQNSLNILFMFSFEKWFAMSFTCIPENEMSFKSLRFANFFFF